MIFSLYVNLYDTNIRYESNKICNILFEMKFILILYRENYFLYMIFK